MSSIGSDPVEKQPLIVVVGPTASGKTKTGVMLAKLFDGEVVSADSMQIYKAMSVSTAKPTPEEMQGVPHHLIDFADVSISFSVADYVDMAREKIADIASRGKMPIIVGGTGLYINSLIDNVKFDDTCSSTEIRDRLYAIAEEKGNHYLWEKLCEVDPETASKVHENNLSRVVRALEVFEQTGEKLSVHKKNSRLEQSPYSVCMIGLGFNDRAVLYDRINKRVDIMLRNGLVDEARQFYSLHGANTANQAIGIKELKPYLDGNASLDECVEKIKMESRRYAKRQLTWFRRDERINWIYLDEGDLLMSDEELTKILKTIVVKTNFL